MTESTPTRIRTWDRLASIGLFLAILCALSVLAFHFPEFLSNPELRAAYDVEQLRLLLFVSMFLSCGCSLIGLLLSSRKGQGLSALILLAMAACFGGAGVPVQTPIQQKTFYLSLDLIILDLLFMSLIFVPLERVFFLRRQRVLREGLATDLSHYGLNHLLMGLTFYLIAWPGNWLHAQFDWGTVTDRVQGLPLWVQVLAILFIADFVQYWIHRCFHGVRLWRFHRIHHSTEVMDWLAGSRLHIVDVIVTRAVSYVPIVCLGFSNAAVHAYLPIVAIQAVFVHSNTRFTFGVLRYIVTTPINHHWHHSSEEAALDKNFAVTFSCIDLVFGTFYCPRKWPETYGLHQERIPDSFLQQLLLPFRWSRKG